MNRPTAWAAAVRAVLGADADTRLVRDELTAEVAVGSWLPVAFRARDDPTCAAEFFDWLSAYETPSGELVVVAHVWSVRHRAGLLLRTRPPGPSPSLPSLTPVWRGADWHERESREMFGVEFVGHPNPAPLLLPAGFEGHPLRKSFTLASRARPWPGAADPDPRAAGGRRRQRPPGAVDPEWGPR